MLQGYFFISLVFLGVAIARVNTRSRNKSALSNLLRCTFSAATWPITLFFLILFSSENKNSNIIRTTHTSIDIKRTLAENDEDINIYLVNKKGEYLTAKKTRIFLINELSKGYTRYSSCDNRTASGACAGHNERRKIKGGKS